MDVILKVDLRAAQSTRQSKNTFTDYITKVKLTLFQWSHEEGIRRTRAQGCQLQWPACQKQNSNRLLPRTRLKAAHPGTTPRPRPLYGTEAVYA